MTQLQQQHSTFSQQLEQKDRQLQQQLALVQQLQEQLKAQSDRVRTTRPRALARDVGERTSLLPELG